MGGSPQLPGAGSSFYRPIKKMTPEEAKKKIRDNWGKLVKENKLGEALKRYYKLVGKSAGECWEDIKRIMPK